jgi:23S rRNA (uracil1939-C5)-methyltransferase
MVHFFRPQQKEISSKHFALNITDLDIKGRGVARLDNCTWFVEGALPGEEVIVRTIDLKKNIGIAELISVKKRSDKRLHPFCPNFAKCGGCSLQHMSVEHEMQSKVEGIKRLFKKVLQLDLNEPEKIVYEEEESYRRICRLSVTGDKREIHLGFREAFGKKIIEIEKCPILVDSLSDLIEPIRALLNKLSNFKLVGHIELVAADSCNVILVRTINILPKEDIDLLINFAKEKSILCYVLTRHEKQKEDLEQKEEIVCLNPELTKGEKPFYLIKGIKISFQPSDFIQVNSSINEKMVDCGIEYLDPHDSDEVLDLFCGLGNFTLPMASKVKHVYGIEGVWNMVHEANDNAKMAGILNAEFFVHDLDDDFEKTIWAKSNVSKVLLDPGRQGAARVMPYLIKRNVKNIVYVSCNPLTLVRDLGVLLNKGYMINKWSVFDMFPRTEHVETVVLLSRDKA